MPKKGGVATAPGKRIRSAHQEQAVSRGFPIPDSRRWPAEVVGWLGRLKGDYRPRDAAIFDYGSFAAMYCEDAITALAILDVDASSWSVSGDYPTFTFDSAKTTAYGQRLAACGYRVRILEPSHQRELRAKVVDIAVARERLEQKAKGAAAWA